MGNPSTLGYTPGSGANVATQQDDAGAHHQKAVNEFVDEAGTPTPVTPDTPMPTADGYSGNLLLRILQMLMAPLGYDKSLGRQRSTTVLESGTVTVVTTVNNVGTVATITNIAGVGGYPAQMQVFDQNRTAWALSVRACIT
jgi:hypothetical protein